MKYHLIICFLISCVCYGQQDTMAQSCYAGGICCGNDPTPAGVMISHTHSRNEWMLSYRFMNMSMGGVMREDAGTESSEVLRKYNALPEQMQMNMHMLMLMYGVTDRLTFMAMFHYNSLWMSMSMPMGRRYHAHTMSVAGIGDVKVTAIYALMKQHSRQLLLSAGVSLPAGSVNQKGAEGSMMYAGQRYPYNMQLGSGTVDMQHSLTYLSQHERFYYSFQANATLRLIQNKIGYKHGNEYGVAAWAAYRWLPFMSSSVRLEGLLSTRMNGSDPTLDRTQEIGADAANYGGRRLQAYLGSVFQPGRGVFETSKFCAEFGLPLYQYYTGYQMRTNYHFLLTYNLSF